MGQASKHSILIVEDERLLRANAAEGFSDEGYDVLEAANADEALDILRSDEGQVDLAFVDIKLPGEMSGLDLVKWIRTNRPDVKIGIASGSIGAIHRAFRLCGLDLVFPKPYEPRWVARSFRKALN